MKKRKNIFLIKQTKSIRVQYRRIECKNKEKKDYNESWKKKERKNGRDDGKERTM